MIAGAHHIGMCRPKLVLCRSDLKTSIDFAHFGLELGVVYEGTTASVYQFQINKKERVICEFEMDFKKSFCCGINLT